ncbi:hypothetical protein MCUN1_002583 [Malassezia cuniculi]|uniref:Uncharacterized protein n=1 Tax=Malassezia cuniculi TaxID=948313 RepID=A0AAF0EZR7_9BASI|nr:hypothetical protein MCUN1_002583 [Malassezia cuniculi]
MTKLQIEEASLTLAKPPQQLISMRLENMLFDLAAQQCRWRTMYEIVSAIPDGEVSSHMCRSYLQAHSKIASNPRTYNPSENSYCMYLARRFRDEMSMKLRIDKMHEAPPWLVDAALTHLSQAGRVKETVDLVNTYLTHAHGCNGLVVLERRKPRLMDENLIPGHRLLNHMLHACLKSGDSKQSMSLFLYYTHMSEDAETNPHFCIEPVNFSLILVLSSMKERSEAQVEAMLTFIKKAEQRWGLFRKTSHSQKAPTDIPSPLLIDLRPLTIILRRAFACNSQRLVRLILRFQYGLLHRESKWHESNPKGQVLRDSRNEYAITERWDTVLKSCVQRGYISNAHRLALRCLFRSIARTHAKKKK